MVKKQNVAYAAVSVAVIIIGIGLLLVFVFKADDTALDPGKKSTEKLPAAHPYESSALYKKASGYSRAGNIDNALEVLDNAKIEEEDQENRAGCYRLKAQLFMKKNRLEEAETYYRKALSLAVTDSQKAEIFSNLGDLHTDRKYFRKALTAYNDALNIYRKLAQNNPGVYLKDLAMTLHNMGVLYLENPDYEPTPIPGDTLNEALENYEKLAKKNPDAYIPNVAEVYSNLGIYYIKEGNDSKAVEAYGKASGIMKILADEKPNEYLPAAARTLNNLALLDRASRHPGEALANFKKALEIYREFKKKNPDEHLHDMDMSRTLANLGNFYRDNNQFNEAEEAYGEALTIRERLAENNPRGYELEAAKILSLMSYLCYLYLENPLTDKKNEKAYKRKGLSLVNRAIAFFEKYRDEAQAVELLEDARAMKKYFEN